MLAATRQPAPCEIRDKRMNNRTALSLFTNQITENEKGLFGLFGNPSQIIPALCQVGGVYLRHPGRTGDL